MLWSLWQNLSKPQSNVGWQNSSVNECPNRLFIYQLFTFYLVVFPQDILENGISADNFAMLGLGDIVVPGIFIALLLRFDHRYVLFFLNNFRI